MRASSPLISEILLSVMSKCSKFMSVLSPLISEILLSVKSKSSKFMRVSSPLISVISLPIPLCHYAKDKDSKLINPSRFVISLI